MKSHCTISHVGDSNPQRYRVSYCPPPKQCQLTNPFPEAHTHPCIQLSPRWVSRSISLPRLCVTYLQDAPVKSSVSPTPKSDWWRPFYLHCLMKVILVLFKQPEGHGVCIFQHSLASSLQRKIHRGDFWREKGRLGDGLHCIITVKKTFIKFLFHLPPFVVG